MWELYDRLIEPISNEIKVSDIVVGSNWTVLRAGQFAGVAATLAEDNCRPNQCCNWIGVGLQEAANLSKSWNFNEASIGVAAINAWYNNHPKIQNALQSASHIMLCPDENAFDAYAQEAKAKRVAIIGHFQMLERFLKESRVTVLERRPQPSDYPDSACEYILSEQDFVFITGSALTNKTLPRLLQLSSRAKIILTGPSTPMAPLLFEYGIDELSGFVIRDALHARQAVGQGAHKELFQYGEKLRMLLQ